MTRTTIPQSLLSAAARTARAEGVTVEIARNGVVVRVIPETHRAGDAAASSRKSLIQL
jgi:hypothetical protein